MAFPLPIDPEFRRRIVEDWLNDVDDRLSDAEESWKQANSIYLSLGPGEGNLALEDRLYQQRVKLDGLQSTHNKCSTPFTTPTRMNQEDEIT